MSIPNRGFESQVPERLRGQEGDPRPEISPSQLGGAPGPPDVTVPYIPTNALSPAGAALGDSHAERRHYDFLDPPRGPGELGWVDHYRVRRLIGEGGMGLVFEAEDTDLLRRVALKVIRPELAGTSLAAQRFTLEARAMAALKHDHIVTIYQVGQQRGVPFLAMEYLHGTSLDRLLDRGHIPSLELVLRLGREIAAGLAAAHRRGLIHRDIKPANIWLEAPSARVKILDFGLARTKSHDVQITNAGTTVGSPAYMAPEQARGESGDAACDLFSLGCVLYLLCTRELPFPGKTVMAVLASLASDTPSPPGDLNPAVPPALGELVMRLLAKKPEDRPTSAQAVVEAIKTVERELLAQRQTAALLGSAAPMEKIGPAEVVRANGLESASPARIAPGPRAGRRTWRIAAAVLGIATAAAVGGFVLAPTPKKTRGLVADQPTAATGLDDDPNRVVTTQRTRDREFVLADGATDRLRSTEDRAVVADKVATSVPALPPPHARTGSEPPAAEPSQPTTKLRQL